MATIQFTFKNGSVSSRNAESVAAKLRQNNRYMIDISSVKRVSPSFYDVFSEFRDNIVIIDRVNSKSQERLWDLLNDKHKDIEDLKEQWKKVYDNTDKQLRRYGRKIPYKFRVIYKNSMKELGRIVYDSRIEPDDFKVFKEFEDGFDSWKKSVKKWHDKNNPKQENFMLLFGLKEYMGPRLHGAGIYTEKAVHDIYRSYGVGEVPFKLFRIKEKGKHEEIDTSTPSRFKWTSLMEKYCSNIWGGRIIPSIYIISQNDVYTSKDSLPSANKKFQKRLKSARERAIKKFHGFGISEKCIFTVTEDNLEKTIEKVSQSPGKGLAEFIVQIKEKSCFLMHMIASKEKFEQIKKKDTKAFQSKKFYTLDDLKQKLKDKTC